MWTDEARQASAEARKSAVSDWKNKGTSDGQVTRGIAAMFGVGDRGNRQAAATLAQGHPKSGTPRYAIQTLNTKLAGTPWQTMKRVGNNTVAERVAQRMRIDNPNTLIRVK